ncbi:hypothetical protein [Nocardia sp. NBC_00511]|uniref:hypothetical protein n=1 Tax=Nocardia sp. NBC_00511 TaxID=2903591 RepID=UPI0030DEA736
MRKIHLLGMTVVAAGLALGATGVASADTTPAPAPAVGSSAAFFNALGSGSAQAPKSTADTPAPAVGSSAAFFNALGSGSAAAPK